MVLSPTLRGFLWRGFSLHLADNQMRKERMSFLFFILLLNLFE